MMYSLKHGCTSSLLTLCVYLASCVCICTHPEVKSFAALRFQCACILPFLRPASALDVRVSQGLLWPRTCFRFVCMRGPFVRMHLL